MNISKNGAPLGDPDAAGERQRLVEANEQFALRLKRAIERGAETTEGILATAGEPKHFFPWRFTRGLP
jgi:hypothetical protein